MAGDGEFDESKHPRDHGKFSSSEGAGGPSHVTDAHRDQAKHALTDATFVRDNMGRLSAAGDEARAKYPVSEHATDAVHAEAHAAMHEEAARAIAEDEAHGGQSSLRQAAGIARYRASQEDATMAQHHEAAMSAIAGRKAEIEQEQREIANEERAVAAGHISTEPSGIVDRHQSEQEGHEATANEHMARLEQAHVEAATALSALHGQEREEDEDRGISGLEFKHTHELGDAFDETHSAHEDSGAGESKHDFESMAQAHGDVSEHEIPTHPDSDEFEFRHQHPEEGDYQFRNTHPESVEFEHPHPDEDSYDFTHPHPDDIEGPHTPEQHAALLSAHEAERTSALAAHEQAVAAHEKEHAEALASHNAEHAAALSAHNAALDAIKTETARHAETAQSALEHLHEQQTATHEALKETQAASKASHAAADKALSKFGDHDLVTPKATGDDLERAKEASTTYLTAQRSRLDDSPSLDHSEVRSAIKAEQKKTESAIRELSKITGRAPRLPEKQGKPAKPKKSGNRPGTPAHDSVWGMPAPSRTRLKLETLKWLSLVDVPAQETAAIRLIKRKGGEEMQLGDSAQPLTLEVIKVGEGTDPLVYCWAFTCTDGGKPYHDLQGDAITADFIKAAEAFVRAGGPVDEMHAEDPTEGYVAFAYPMDPEIATAMLGKEAGAAVKTSGLMVAIRPTAEQLVKLRNKEYTGVSIAGTGIRELVKTDKPKCAGCGQYGSDNDEKCSGCGKAMKRARRPVPSRLARPVPARTAKSTWTTADVDGLPDSSFLYVEPGGKADADGKTAPRSLRHFPYKDASGTVDVPHLRDAIGRIPQSSLPKDVRDKLQVKAEKLLAAQHDKASKRVRKDGESATVVLTSPVDGHQHSIDLDDPADSWSDQLSTSYQTADGATQGHSHAWVYDDTTGKVTIAQDSGHTHEVEASVPADVLRQAALNESGERCPGCGELAEASCRFCPKCGAAMDRRDGVPVPVTDEDSGSGAAVVVISARAPRRISTPSGAAPTVKGEPKEHEMADLNDRIRDLEAKNARLEKMATLSDGQRKHFETLKGADAEQFLALRPDQRQTTVDDIAKADSVIYTSTETGREYRKSCPLEIIEAVKATDAALKMQRATEVEKQNLVFSKRGDELLTHFAKGTKGDMRGRIAKALHNEFKEPAEYDEVVKAIKAANYALEQLTVAKGVNPHADPTETVAPLDAWNTGLGEFAKSKNIAEPLDAIVPFLKTDKGKALKGALDALRPNGQAH